MSSYINFNIIIGLHIAQDVARSKNRVYIVYKTDLPSTMLDFLDHNVAKYVHVVKRLDDIDLLQTKPIIIAMLNTADIDLFNAVINKVHNFYIFTPRFSLPKEKFDYPIYRVQKIKEGLFIVYKDTNEKYLIKVFGNNLEEISIPNEVVNICNELKELVVTFGSVKASNFVKYCSRKYGYSREECIELLRQAISLKLIKYVSGYLYP
ncbi:MAG: hypothetical protein QXZ41_00650 [Ignisphaera sp.]|uniref:Uncharacterized protein n=1 Tax=Ignisphaera aggregans TaxID=334771 RepID=A0A7C4JIQ1_9CREN